MHVCTVVNKHFQLQELSQTKEECTQTKERITMEVYQSEEMNRSEVINLRVSHSIIHVVVYTVH